MRASLGNFWKKFCSHWKETNIKLFKCNSIIVRNKVKKPERKSTKKESISAKKYYSKAKSNVMKSLSPVFWPPSSLPILLVWVCNSPNRYEIMSWLRNKTSANFLKKKLFTFRQEKGKKCSKKITSKSTLIEEHQNDKARLSVLVCFCQHKKY